MGKEGRNQREGFLISANSEFHSFKSSKPKASLYTPAMGPHKCPTIHILLQFLLLLGQRFSNLSINTNQQILAPKSLNQQVWLVSSQVVLMLLF